ncbi:DUF4238 domain-containing protein [Saccharothrix xinjiangensis]|uniref:DUF4238 domain-containing protein n=1 Tax=Saccharothrix xinjiangensis TaxID=204798 RepID=A0ABV9Y2J4_9PSEU
MSPWTSPREVFSQEYEARLQALRPGATELIKKQHIVSQALLRRFAGQDSNGGAVLVPFDVEHGRELKQTGPAGCAWIPHFVPYASKSVEELWQTVENKLGAAIDMVERGRLDLNTTRTIKDTMALHLVRSDRYRRIHNDGTTRVPDQVRNRVLIRYYDQLLGVYIRRNHRLPDSPRDLIRLADELVSEQASSRLDGSDMRVMIEQTFESAKQMLNSHALEVWSTPPGSELLISDAPAFTMQYSADRRTTRIGVAIGDAHAIVMPLSRTTLACIGRKKKRDVLTAERVAFINEKLIQNATRFVYYSPDSQLKSFVSLVQPTRRSANQAGSP